MKKKLIILLICGISLLTFSCGNLKKNEEEKKADLNMQNVEIKSKIKLAFIAQKDVEVVFWNSEGKITDKQAENLSEFEKHEKELELLKKSCADKPSDFNLIQELLTLQKNKSLLNRKRGLKEDIENRIEEYLKKEK